MKIKRGYLLLIISTMMLGVKVPNTLAQLPDFSKAKAEIYVKITSNISCSYQDKNSHLTENYSIMVEGTTELSADYFDDDEGYYELLPIKRDIKATCNGSGVNEQCSWTYSLDGKELKNGHNEFIELINSFYIYPSEEKDIPQSYKIYFNDNALAAISHYHTLVNETCDSKSSVVEGDYSLNISAASCYTWALEDKNGLENFKERKFELENGKLVSQGKFSYVYTEPTRNEVCHINVVYAINQKPEDEDIELQLNGCGSLVVGETTILPVNYKPTGGKIKYWAEGKGISVSNEGGGAKVTGTAPGEGTVWAEYTTNDGEKVKKSKVMTSLKLNSINQGEPLKIGLYDAKGRRLKSMRTVPVRMEPADKSYELLYNVADESIVNASPTGNSLLAVHGLVKGKTTIQATSNCGTNTGPAFNVEVLNCDDDVMKELKSQARMLDSRKKSNLYQQNELLTNNDFMEADKNGAKAIQDVANGLEDVAIKFATANGANETLFKGALKIKSDVLSLQGNVADQNYALIAWQVANMVPSKSKASEVSSAVKTVLELHNAVSNLGAYLGTAFGAASQLAELAEQYDKTQKELFEVQRIMYEVCGKDEVNPKGDPDDNEGEEQAKEDSEKPPKNDPKKNDPKPNQKNQPEANDVPANQSEPTSSKTGNDVPDKASPEPGDQTPKTDNPSSEPKTYSVGIDVGPEGKCGCAPNLNSTTMLSPENSKDTDDALKLMNGINDVRQCYDNLLQSTLHPLLEELKSLEAFYAELEAFSKLSERERQKEFEKLKTTTLGLELDKGQRQLFQVEEFRFASGGCGAQIKDKIHTGFKMK
jgi:hypothetical protein